MRIKINQVWRVATVGGLLAVAMLAGSIAGRGPAAHAGSPQDCYMYDLAVQEEPNEPCLITLTKELMSDSTAEVGDTVTFRITVTNDGWVPLDGMVVVDTFDSSKLEFTSADPAPTGVDDGMLYWELPDPDDDEDPVWEYGDSQTITVRFEASDETEGTQNCAVAGAVVAQEQPEGDISAAQEFEIDVESEEDCARLQIDERKRRDRDPTATPTEQPDTPEPTASPVVTVLPATVVPTPPAGVVLPDTGTGPGNDSGANNGLVILAAVGSAIIAGSALRLRKSR